jgi:hypothetical protein
MKVTGEAKTALHIQPSPLAVIPEQVADLSMEILHQTLQMWLPHA